MILVRNNRLLSATVVLLLLGGSLHGETTTTYLDSRGRKIVLPLGGYSFADEVVAFENGNPSAPEKHRQPQEALGPPNYNKKSESNYVTLGCGGTLTLRFTDNALVDVDGPDLYVFEIGPNIEPTELSLSADGNRWVRVGQISGGKAEVDIHDVVQPNEVFHFVRLTDLKSACSGRWPGADIDAVGAIGAGLLISLKNGLLFDVDQFLLKPEATQSLREAAQKIMEHKDAKIRIGGHTDSTGSTEHNLTLSQNRAQAVRDFLVKVAMLDPAQIETHGYGESRPIASNNTVEGREKNRRVEIIVIPAKPVAVK
ncbi:MAG: OmpA family protein [Terriglobia bacterium]